MLTPFYPFSWKWEESALQFYDLIPLGEISVAPGMSNAQGMENRKYALPPSVSVCVCVTVTNTHTQKMFVCTLKYLCVGVCNPWVLALCLKKHAKLLYLSSPSLSATLFTSSWYSSLLDWVVRYVQSESADQRGRQASGWVLAVFRVRDKPWLRDEWPVKRRWQLETHTTYNSRLQRQTNTLKPFPLMYYHDCSGVKTEIFLDKSLKS